MSRLIDVDKFKVDCGMADDCEDCKQNASLCQYDIIYSKMDFCGWLDDAPTVDAVPVVHGRWIKMGHIEHTWLVSKCSVCGNQTIDAGTYCTNCGARMDGKDGEQA